MLQKLAVPQTVTWPVLAELIDWLLLHMLTNTCCSFPVVGYQMEHKWCSRARHSYDTVEKTCSIACKQGYPKLRKFEIVTVSDPKMVRFERQELRWLYICTPNSIVSTRCPAKIVPLNDFRGKFAKNGKLTYFWKLLGPVVRQIVNSPAKSRAKPNSLMKSPACKPFIITCKLWAAIRTWDRNQKRHNKWLFWVCL